MWKRISFFLFPCFSEPKYDKPRKTAADIEDALAFPEMGLVHADQDLLKSVHSFDSLQDAYLAVKTNPRDLKNRDERNAKRIEDLENEVDRQAEIIEDLESMVERHVDFHEDLQDRIEFFGMQNKKRLADLNDIKLDYAARISMLEDRIIRGGLKDVVDTKNATAEKDWNEIIQEAHQLLEQIECAVKGEMKYRSPQEYSTCPSRWSFIWRVSSASVFFAAFRMNAVNELGGMKLWDKRISVNDFKSIVGGCDVPVESGILRLVGDHILLKWNDDERRFTVSGEYSLCVLESSL